MHLIDWTIIGALMLLLLVGAMSTRQHASSVAGYLAADRCGGRYLIAVSDQIAKLGVITLVWYFEQNYDAGFTSIWWQLMEEPVLIVMALSGWVIYRFRQTRSMTMAEFFEKRYSRKFRIFAGIVAFVAGIINFGIFPSVGARFFIQLWSLPETFSLLGVQIQTFAAVMVALLIVPMALLLLGGQIAVMVTDFLQGVVANIAFIAIILFLLLHFTWPQISETLMAQPAGKSMVDPFNVQRDENFNVLYYFISVVTLFYGAYAWFGTQGYAVSAINAHEAKMAFILGQWRFRVLMLIVIVLPICIKTFLTHPDYANQARATHDAIQAVQGAQLETQLRTPIAMRTILPAGLVGLASAALLGAFISTHDTYLHSWSAIFVQDVLMPITGRRFSERTHLLLLRCSVVGIAAFILVFSYVFKHQQYISMYCSQTAAVFVGGAGIAIIGGLYWNRGTTAAAWAGMIVGLLLSLFGVVVKQVPDSFLFGLTQSSHTLSYLGRFSLWFRNRYTGAEMSMITLCCASATYVLVSLAQWRSKFNLDKLLHRGDYAMEGESSLSIRDARGFWERLGFSKEFKGSDRAVVFVTLSWPLFWSIVFFSVLAYRSTRSISAEAWLSYWHVWTWVILISGAIVTCWLSIGGFRDLRSLYRKLKTRSVDPRDDGFVDVEHAAAVPGAGGVSRDVDVGRDSGQHS
ncbi:MAG: sodium:solute symporter [Phycisphaerales bacterium]|nr:sodium:solute symporter [Phycisphaerales bacterium]MCB9863800.1 sodium:solute symporter [Phycisphaerales bacterium]